MERDRGTIIASFSHAYVWLRNPYAAIVSKSSISKTNDFATLLCMTDRRRDREYPDLEKHS